MWARRPGFTVFPRALSLSQHHGQLPCPFPGSLEVTGKPHPSLSPHPLVGQCPCLPRHHAQFLTAETQIPLIRCLLSTSHGGGEGRRGACGGSLRGLSKPLVSWEVLDAKLRGCLACMCSAWIPLSIMDPRIAPLSAQVDAQLMGRSSQKAERGTKVEMVGGGRSSWCPLSALHALCKALGEDATLPLSSCLDRAWLCGASSEKGRQTGRDAVLGVL